MDLWSAGPYVGVVMVGQQFVNGTNCFKTDGCAAHLPKKQLVNGTI